MDKLSKNHKMILGGLAVIIASIIGYYLMSTASAPEDKNMAQNTTVQNIQNLDTGKEIVIHVTGSVEKEGVVKLPDGSRIVDAIDKSGGLAEDADLSKINLAQILTDGQKVHIPSKGEQEESTGDSSLDATSDTSNGKVNINTADAAKLQTLTGIGPATANNIIKHRKENGQFASIEDIMDVTGIGDAKFNSIKDKITV